MGKNFTVVVRVPVQNLTDEEAEDLRSDTLGFLTEFDLWEEGTVDEVRQEPTVPADAGETPDAGFTPPFPGAGS